MLIGQMTRKSFAERVEAGAMKGRGEQQLPGLIKQHQSHNGLSKFQQLSGQPFRAEN